MALPSIIASSTPRSASSILPSMRRFINKKTTHQLAHRHQQYKICYIPHRSYQYQYRYQRGLYERIGITGNECGYICSTRSSIHKSILQSFSSKSDVIDIHRQTTADTSNLLELIKESYNMGETIAYRISFQTCELNTSKAHPQASSLTENAKPLRELLL